jgi:hypothetical protein
MDKDLTTLFMENASIYIAMAIIGLLVLPALYFAIHKKYETRLSRIAALAFAFIIAGLFLSRKELVGYSLLGVGLVLAIVDIVQKRKNNYKSHAPH